MSVAMGKQNIPLLRKEQEGRRPLPSLSPRLFYSMFFIKKSTNKEMSEINKKSLIHEKTHKNKEKPDWEAGGYRLLKSNWEVNRKYAALHKLREKLTKKQDVPDGIALLISLPGAWPT